MALLKQVLNPTELNVNNTNQSLESVRSRVQQAYQSLSFLVFAILSEQNNGWNLLYLQIGGAATKVEVGDTLFTSYYISTSEFKLATDSNSVARFVMLCSLEKKLVNSLMLIVEDLIGLGPVV
jgi:hypothetical protein